jgi:hypothetical protein
MYWDILHPGLAILGYFASRLETLGGSASRLEVHVCSLSRLELDRDIPNLD